MEFTRRLEIKPHHLHLLLMQIRVHLPRGQEIEAAANPTHWGSKEAS